MAESTAKLNILVQLRDQATDSMRRMGNAAQDLGGSLSFTGDKAGILAGGLAAIGGAVILKSINAFSEAQAKMKQAEAIFKTLPDGIAKFQTAIEAGNEAQRRFGFDNEEVTLALARFAQAAEGDMGNALIALQAALGVAVARFGGVSGLKQAVDQILPSFAGGARALRALGINIDENVSAVTGLQIAVKATQAQLDGWGESLAGQRAILKAYGGDVLEELGAPYGFVLGKLPNLIGAHADLGDTITKLSPLIQGFGVALGIATVFFTIKAIPLLTRTAAGFLGVAGAANITGVAISIFAFKLLLILGAIALVVAAGILLVRHWDDVKKFLSATWISIKEVAINIFTEIIRFFEKFPENMGRILGLTVLVFFRAFEAISQFLFVKIPEIVNFTVSWFATLPDRILAALSALPGRIESFFRSMVSNIQSVFNGLVDFILGIPNRIANFGRDVLGKSVDFINRFIEGFNTTPGLPAFLKLPTIPKFFAEGGVVTKPTLGILGEAGAEAVVPLNRLAFAGGGGITINLQGDFFTDMEAAERWGNALARIIKFQLKL